MRRPRLPLYTTQGPAFQIISLSSVGKRQGRRGCLREHSPPHSLTFYIRCALTLHTSKGFALTWHRALTWYSSPAQPFAAPDVPLLVTGQQRVPTAFQGSKCVRGELKRREYQVKARYQVRATACYTRACVSNPELELGWESAGRAGWEDLPKSTAPPPPPPTRPDTLKFPHPHAT